MQSLNYPSFCSSHRSKILSLVLKAHAFPTASPQKRIIKGSSSSSSSQPPQTASTTMLMFGRQSNQLILSDRVTLIPVERSHQIFE